VFLNSIDSNQTKRTSKRLSVISNADKYLVNHSIIIRKYESLNYHYCKYDIFQWVLAPLLVIIITYYYEINILHSNYDTSKLMIWNNFKFLLCKGCGCFAIFFTHIILRNKSCTFILDVRHFFGVKGFIPAVTDCWNCIFFLFSRL
jgi:hypothetical protein